MLPDNILTNILRPGRYVGGEWNLAKKNLSKVKFKICLCFPEIYEIGMSHLGIRILYDILNSAKDVFCDRAFCPWPDFKQALIGNSLRLSSLEANIPLRNFDILGFSLNNELNYTNILTMFSLSDIPPLSKDRAGDFPLIIGGGNCTLNPEPIADFFDLFVVGEAEEAILEIIKICKKFKRAFGNIYKEKRQLLIELCQIPGVYVPQFYHVEYNQDKTVKEFKPLIKQAPSVIRKAYVRDLNRNLRFYNWVVPNIAIIHDRIGIEIMRGCVHQCRFCQARSYSYPLRIRSPKTIFNLAKKLYGISGYEQISLLSLSTSDHPRIKEILRTLIPYFNKKAVSISLPSIRPKNIAGEVSNLLSLQRKTGLTFAPEAGSEKLRKVINKNIDIEELHNTVRDVFKVGYRRVKLYFMIGLPGEEYKDLDAIIDLSYKLSNLRREFSNRPAEINISVSTFIPKPHTPFQWFNMSSIKDIQEKQVYLRRLITKDKRNLNISFHDVYMSNLEAALSRGHRQISNVIRSAYDKSAQFDQWKEHFKFDIWRSSFSDNGLDMEDYAIRPLSLDRVLIWDFIETGLEKQYLIEEFQKALT